MEARLSEISRAFLARIDGLKVEPQRFTIGELRPAKKWGNGANSPVRIISLPTTRSCMSEGRRVVTSGMKKGTSLILAGWGNREELGRESLVHSGS